MHELVLKILDKSKEQAVDVLVARDMVIAENIEKENEIRTAYTTCVDKYYDLITALRRNKDNATIEKLCSYIETGDIAAISKLKNEILK